MSSPPGPPRSDAYRALAAHRASLGRGGEVAFDPLRSRADVLTPAESAVLAACHGPATLAEHAARALAAGVRGTSATILATLADLAARGVLVSDEAIGRLLAEAPPASMASREAGASGEPRGAVETDEGLRVSVLGAPTRDRPRALRRAIEGYARDIAEHGRAIEIVIVDDGVASSGETATVAREVARRFGVRVRLIDRPARVLLAKAVADLAGAPLPIVERALAPHAPDLFAAGAARNVLLLAGVDRGLLQIDDDTVCDLRAAPDARPGLRARSFEDPTEMWFDEHEMASKQGESANAPAALPGPLGYASAHEQLLGRSATSLILSAMARGEADLAGASPSLLLRAARGGRARCTQIGVRGHSALGTMVYLLTIGEPTRGRLLASEATYRASIASRRLLRAVPAATLTDVDACMTYGIGLDARSLLPPFPPVERNEDGLFGVMLAACDPTAFFGHLPFTIGHEPEDARPSRFDLVFEQAGRVGVNDVIAGLVSASHHEIDHRSPAAAQESLGRALLAWTELPEEELFERVTWMLARRLAQRLARIAALLRESRREPLFWARDLERLADVLRERVEDPERAVPFELAARHAGSMARGLTVRRIREYAEILAWWPAVWEAARALRARGDAVGEVYA